mgnify:CR=1 FL=1
MNETRLKGNLLIFYHNIPAAVNKCANISLPIFSVQIRAAVIDYARNSRIIVNELDSVALFDYSSVAVIGIVYASFAQSPAQTVVGECRAVVVRHLPAVRPLYRFSAISCRIYFL